jgi:SAM-dependent methyltransferase
MDLPLAATVAFVALAGLGCAPLGKLDGWNVFSRDTFQRPRETLESIPVWPGAQVADLGAGNGYFTWKLADAVGASGHVWSVEVTEKLVAKLERGVAERGLGNVTVVHGGYEDPRLPDARIDVVLLSSVYHHIEDRPAYMARLRADLAPGARVAIVEPRAGWESWLLLLPPGHGVAVDTMRAEMRAAGYEPLASFDFLPAHSFEVFRVAGK